MEESPYCFPWQLHQFTFLPTVREGLFSPHPHQYLFIFCLIIAILTGVRWCLIVVLVCISLWLVELAPFHLPADHLYVFLAKIFLQDPLPTLQSGFFFFFLVFCELFLYVGYKSLIRCIIYRYLPPIQVAVFCLLVFDSSCYEIKKKADR